MRVLVALLVMAAACASSDGDEREARTKQCERLREHVIDVRLADARGVDLDAHRAAMRSALGADFLASCSNDMTDTQIECALEASDSGTAAKCGTSRR